MTARRASTGIVGLDEILRGGLPRNRTYLVQGQPGTGKTTLALQFLLRGLADGESGLYVSLSETQEEIQELADAHGWDLSGIDVLELTAIQQLTCRENQNTVFHTSSVELSETETLLCQRIAECRPLRVVIDSLSELHMLAVEPWVDRLQLLRLKQFFTTQGVTTLLLDDLGQEEVRSQPRSIVHGVITLMSEVPDYGSFRRRLRVHKLRGVPFMEGDHDMAIRTGGMEVYPRLIAAELGNAPAFSGSVTSGIAELDILLGGQLDRGTTNLIIGPAGVGKSTLAAQFALHGVDQGARAILYLFDERVETVIRRWAGLGRDIRPCLEHGLMVRHVDPAELTAGAFAADVRRAIEQEEVSILIIDSLTGYQQAMVGERALMLQLHEMQTFLGNQGVTTIIVNAQHGLSTPPSSDVDISYLSDTVILLRYYEFRGTIRKALSVFKRRTGYHEASIRDLEIGASGIKVGHPLTDFRGVLTGSPVYIASEMPFGAGMLP